MPDEEVFSQVLHTVTRSHSWGQMWSQAPPDRVTRGLSRNRGVLVAQSLKVSVERGRHFVSQYRVTSTYWYWFFKGQWQEKHLLRAFRGLSSTIVGVLSTVNENYTALARLTSRLLLRDNPIWRTSECENTTRTGLCLIECGHLALTRKEELATGRQGGSV